MFTCTTITKSQQNMLEKKTLSNQKKDQETQFNQCVIYIYINKFISMIWRLKYACVQSIDRHYY